MFMCPMRQKKQVINKDKLSVLFFLFFFFCNKYLFLVYMLFAFFPWSSFVFSFKWEIRLP